MDDTSAPAAPERAAPNPRAHARIPDKAGLIAIAGVCHAANMAYCATLGDHSHEPWDKTDQSIRDSVVNGVLRIADGTTAQPRDSHESWLAFKTAAGWTYGTRKSLAKKQHPNLVPYDMLPPEEQQKDALFFAVAYTLLNPYRV